jgi:general secretion pathway protein G
MESILAGAGGDEWVVREFCLFQIRILLVDCKDNWTVFGGGFLEEVADELKVFPTVFEIFFAHEVSVVGAADGKEGLFLEREVAIAEPGFGDGLEFASEFGDFAGGEVSDDVIIAFVKGFAAEDDAFEGDFSFWSKGAVAENAMDGVPGLVGFAKVVFVPLGFDFFDDEVREFLVSRAGEETFLLFWSEREVDAAAGHAESLWMRVKLEQSLIERTVFGTSAVRFCPTSVRKGSRHQVSGGVLSGLLIAIVLLSFLFLLVWPAFTPPLPPALIAKTTVDLQNIAGAAEQFRLMAGRYPTNMNEMVSNSLNQIFIDMKERRPSGTNDGKFLDPWMRRYIFVPPLEAGSTGYVASLGKDGISGGVGVNADQVVGLTNLSGAMQK